MTLYGFGYSSSGGASGSGGGSESFSGDGSETTFTVTSFTANDDTLLFLDSDLVSKDLYTRSGNSFTFDTAPFAGQTIRIKN